MKVKVACVCHKHLEDVLLKPLDGKVKDAKLLSVIKVSWRVRLSVKIKIVAATPGSNVVQFRTLCERQSNKRESCLFDIVVD